MVFIVNRCNSDLYQIELESPRLFTNFWPLNCFSKHFEFSKHLYVNILKFDAAGVSFMRVC